jgi:proteasome lid subunit RPN8/RPN11
MNETQTKGGDPRGRLRSLSLTKDIIAILDHTVRNAGDREECGLLGGLLDRQNKGIVTIVHHLTNISRLSSNFAVDIDEFLRSKEVMEASGLVPIALFHTHPNGSTQPSLRDTRLPWITGLLSLIIAGYNDKLLMECYTDVEGKHMAIKIEQHPVPGLNVSKKNLSIRSMAESVQ